MLRTLKDLFDSLLVSATAGTTAGALQSDDYRVQLATAVLLVEVMRADTETSAGERQAVLGALRSKFNLADDALARLVELAEQTARSATDFHAFTWALNTHFDAGQKLRVVEAMWQVAYADGHLAAHENHVLWRIADLLHVQHGAYINAKMRAKAAAGLG